MQSDARLSYWLKGQEEQNFGDLLSELLLESFRETRGRSPGRLTPAHDFDVVHLIGSVISDHHIASDLAHARAMPEQPIVFWGCGLRAGKPPRRALARHCRFLGVRGPLSRDILKLPADTPCVDPGLLAPILRRARRASRRATVSLCVPHFLEPRDDADLLDQTKADRIARPNISMARPDLIDLIDLISGADFVLAGALHAAIVAAAYGVPFAYFDSGKIDVPFKWRDFSASIQVPTLFARSVAEGKTLYAERTQPNLRLPPLVPLLDCAPFRAPKGLLDRAGAFDARQRAP